MAMGQAIPAGTVEAHVQGGVSGQVAVGNNICQIGSNYGVVVNVAQPGQQPHLCPHPTPVLLRPRPFADLLDRETEVTGASAALQSAQPVEFYGQEGLGKTAILRYLAYDPFTTAFPDGIVYHRVRRQPPADLLQFLVDAFYESDASFKASDAQARHALQNRQALILLDDVELARDEVDALMNAAPRCVFLLASPERCLWGEGRSIALGGLPVDKAVALVGAVSITKVSPGLMVPRRIVPSATLLIPCAWCCATAVKSSVILPSTSFLFLPLCQARWDRETPRHMALGLPVRLCSVGRLYPTLVVLLTTMSNFRVVNLAPTVQTFKIFVPLIPL
jgi:hypothetical protein